MNYDSTYKEFAGQTLEWLTSDLESLYQENLITNYATLEENGWIDYEPFYYKFNSLGFRSDEFKENGIMFLGCSHTCGIGMPFDKIWPTLMSNELGLPQCNFGQGGMGSDTAFRLCYGFIDKVKPKVIVYLQPAGPRFELINRDEIHPITHYNDKFIDLFHLLSDNTNIELTLKKNFHAIQHLCIERGIKFVAASTQFGNKMHYEDRARDLLHAGIKSHRTFADIILENFF